VLPAAVTSATYDLANRLTARTSAGVTASPTFDANGNLTSDGVRTYTWDARNRLSGITGVASFGYDTFNRRQTGTAASGVGVDTDGQWVETWRGSIARISRMGVETVRSPSQKPKPSPKPINYWAWC
jgi:hypothetical protein